MEIHILLGPLLNATPLPGRVYGAFTCTDIWLASPHIEPRLLPALQQFDRRTVGLSLLLYFVAGAELSVIHHMGHNLVCASEGYEFNIWVNPFGGYSTCYGTPENHLLYVTLGPIFGAMAAGAPLAVPKIRRSGVWRIVLLALLANEALKIPVEMAVQMPSSVPALHVAMLLFQYGVLATLVLTFARKEKRVAILS